MNITILDYHISYVPYISQVPPTSPIIDQFPMDIHRNIYVLSIDNEDPLLESTYFQLLRDK